MCSPGGGDEGIARQAGRNGYRAAAEIIPELVEDESSNYAIAITTDLGNDFRGLEAALPGGVVHRHKHPSDHNTTAMVDRAIQALKKDLARWPGRAADAGRELPGLSRQRPKF